MPLSRSSSRSSERELLLARRKAEAAAKDRADLLAMMSHDIRNPLNAIMGVVQLLERSELTDAQRRSVRLLKSSSENMLALLDHVLQLSKAESSSFALVETPFPLGELVDEVVAVFAAKGREKGLQVRGTVDERVPATLLGDPIAIRQILMNLVGNAVKFTERGHVEVAVSCTERAADAATLAFSVTDTGIGIATEMAERIFDEFTQAGYETMVKFGGSGLGLTITRKLLAMYGSRVQVASRPGEGSVFSFSLKLALPKERESPAG